MKKCLHAFSKASSESNAQPLKLMPVVNSTRTLKPFNFNLLNNKVEFFLVSQAICCIYTFCFASV